MDALRRFRGCFLAAAIYNALWGLWVSIWPEHLFQLIGIPSPTPISLWQCVGMLVGLYAIAYWLVYRDPKRYGGFAIIGLAGKILGPIGFLFAVNRGDLPLAFGWVNVGNDLIWLPAFALFVVSWVKFERQSQ